MVVMIMMITLLLNTNKKQRGSTKLTIMRFHQKQRNSEYCNPQIELTLHLGSGTLSSHSQKLSLNRSMLSQKLATENIPKIRQQVYELSTPGEPEHIKTPLAGMSHVITTAIYRNSQCIFHVKSTSASTVDTGINAGFQPFA